MCESLTYSMRTSGLGSLLALTALSAIGERETNADDQVARRAVPVTQRSAVVGRNRAADRRLVERRFDWQPLPVPRQRSIDVIDARARLDCRRQIREFMRDESTQTFRAEQNVNG